MWGFTKKKQIRNYILNNFVIIIKNISQNFSFNKFINATFFKPTANMREKLQ